MPAGGKRLYLFFALAAYWLFFTWRGLTAWFTTDDATNLYFLHNVLSKPWPTAVFRAFLFPTSDYRPLGGAVYATIYGAFGFHPFPFRLICFVLMAANLVIARKLFHELTESETAAWLGTLIFCYHAGESDLYFNTGTIYDLLCFPLCLLAVLVYLRMQKQPGVRTGLRMALIACLTVLALNAKEIAFSIPGILIAAEIAFGFNQSNGRRNRIATILITGALVAVSAWFRLNGPAALPVNPLYRPHYSIGFALASLRRYFDELTYSPGFFGTLRFGALVAVASGIALAAKDRRVWFGLGWFCITVAPVLLIAPRAAFVLYLPSAGLALAFAALLDRIARRWMNRPVPGAAIFAAMTALLVVFHWGAHRRSERGALEAPARYRDFVSDLAWLTPSVTGRTTMLLRNDPFGPDDSTPTALIHLRFAQPDMVVLREWPDNWNASIPYLNLFQYVVEYRQGRAEKVQHAYSAPRPPTPLSNPVHMRFDPAMVKPGDPYTVVIPGFQEQIVSVRYLYRKAGFTLNGTAIAWTFVDASAVARLKTPIDMEPGTVTITEIRALTSNWMPAEGFIEVTTGNGLGIKKT